MFHRLRGLFQRYARRHRRIEAPGFPLAPAGHVDRVVLSRGRVMFIGWSPADRVILTGADGQSVARPGIARQDVADATGFGLRVGFEISQPYGDGRFTLSSETGGTVKTCETEPFSAALLRRSRIALAARFALALLRAAPAIADVLLTANPAARNRIKTALGLDTRPEAAPLAPGLFAAPGLSAPPAASVPVTLVMPVYNAFDLLPEVLDRVVRHTDLPWRLVLIEDCSPDARVRPWLRDWVARQEAAGPGRIVLLENAANKGFIGSVNAGLTHAAGFGAHVILLNSDALVPPGWASRLLGPLLAHADVASVTPMSNDAEIFSVPAICQREPLRPGQGDAIDASTGRFAPDMACPEVPTGVGFCMALRREYLQKIPALDPVFGRGYGEEVDWCQKARRLGGRHLAQPRLFVEHRGGTSFGSTEKQKLVLDNNRIIASRYPAYDSEVQNFIAADPLVSARLALAMAWAAGQSGDAVPVYLAHSLGGGADDYLERRIADDLKTRNRPSVVLRVGGNMRWQLEVISGRGRVAGMTDDFSLVEELLAPLRRRCIIYSCGVGDADPVTLPRHLLALQRTPEDAIEVLVHDYFMLSPSYTLLDSDGVYRGPVDVTRTDIAHTTRAADGIDVSLADWRAAWGRLLRAATRIMVFSTDSWDMMLTADPALGPALDLCPHALLNNVPRLSPPGGERRVIAVLGNIGFQKGAAVVAELGRLLEHVPEMDLVVIGNVDPAYMPPPRVPVHGDYRIADLPGLAARYGITDWLIPSVWPETFSYTTHECLATGLPTFAFDIGAQGAAVARAQNGRVVNFGDGSDLAQSVYKTLLAGSHTQSMVIETEKAEGFHAGGKRK